MSSTTMRRMELLLLKADMDGVLRYLSAQNCFQIIYPQDKDNGKTAKNAAKADDAEAAYLSRLDGAMSKLEKLGSCLGLQDVETDLGAAHLPDEALLAEVDKLSSFCSDYEGEVLEQRRKVDDLEGSLREARAFAGMSLPFEDINKLAFVALRIGSVDPSRLPALEKALDNRAVIIPLDNSGKIIAVASRKGRFALETELARVGFQKVSFSPDFRGVPTEALAALEKAYDSAKLRIDELLAIKKEKAEQLSAVWISMVSSVKLGRALKRVERRLEETEWVYRLTGWVPADKVEVLVRDIRKMFGDRVAIRIYDPEDGSPDSKNETGEVPVLLKQNAFVSAFQSIVLSYGTPLYGDIDPTPFVAFFFTLLFAIMFGDMGQGAIIIGLGLLMAKSKKGLLSKYKKFWAAFVAAGTGSMVMGFLVGSIFSDEAVLKPVERYLTGLIFTQPRDRFLDIMPQDSLSSMFYFFGFTVGIGFLINSTGLVINIINLIRRGQVGEALFSKTGLSGALIFWWAAGMAVRIILGGHLGWIDFPGLGLPLLALFLTEPLARAVNAARNGKKDGEGEKSSMIDVLVGGMVEVIEAFSYYASNTMSFLRVAAFALAHAVLSFVVFTMAELVRTRAPGGVILQLVIFVVGNAIIISLEGLIVTIQVIRLQYYEFFSKFFTRTGKTFEPIRFDA
jgi:V/A-type H+/Na+-transporting ATPase subunit I